jgi:hypothetical protein
MGFNFFAWLREGVRQAVLLGVTDAVENLGTPREDDQVSHRLREMLQTGPAMGHQRLPGSSVGSSSPTNPGQKRKKLGRTLEEIQASTAKAA